MHTPLHAHTTFTYHPLPAFTPPSTTAPGLLNPLSTSLSTPSLTSPFRLSSSSTLSLSAPSSPHTKFPAPPRPARPTGNCCPSGCHGVLTLGLAVVGKAVASEGVEKVPSLAS